MVRSGVTYDGGFEVQAKRCVSCAPSESSVLFTDVIRHPDIKVPSVENPELSKIPLVLLLRWDAGGLQNMHRVQTVFGRPQLTSCV